MELSVEGLGLRIQGSHAVWDRPDTGLTGVGNFSSVASFVRWVDPAGMCFVWDGSIQPQLCVRWVNLVAIVCGKVQSGRTCVSDGSIQQ